jgi:hypothetical protein
MNTEFLNCQVSFILRVGSSLTDADGSSMINTNEMSRIKPVKINKCIPGGGGDKYIWVTYFLLIIVETG